MRLGLMIGYGGARLTVDVALVQEAERLGFDSVWTAEAWGGDACTPLGYLAAQTSRIKLGTAIMQTNGRTPANAAMTAMSIDHLSGGRFVMGLGTSGPQVVEGWHGQPFDKPLVGLREYIAICRKIFAREAPLEFAGEKYAIPYRGPDATGQGKPLKSILHGRKDLAIYTGSMSPRGQELAGEIADGCLLAMMDPEKPEIFERQFRAGFEKAGTPKDFTHFDMAVFIGVMEGTDIDSCRVPMKMGLALYVGGMGSREKNFYNAYVRKLGFEDEARKVQDLYLGGNKFEAVAAIPDALVDAMHLVGPRERIRDRLAAWKASNTGTLIVTNPTIENLRLLAELAL